MPSPLNGRWAPVQSSDMGIGKKNREVEGGGKSIGTTRILAGKKKKGKKKERRKIERFLDARESRILDGQDYKKGKERIDPGENLRAGKKKKGREDMLMRSEMLIYSPMG